MTLEEEAVPTAWTEIDSPIGPLLLTAAGGRLTGLFMSPAAPPPGAVRDADGVLAAARDQLGAYFAGAAREFDLPHGAHGTDFQQAVWSGLAAIPYGETRTYGQLAAAIGRPAAVRAVGLANGRNPISIVVPCHRVIGADGTLTGYGGGLERKQFLLDLEAR
jgi:methylated-DNA-[protein]-cysteine S-methyltransferase